LLESYVAGHAQFGRPMTRVETERFYDEYRGLGRLAGVRERDLPEDWAGFRAYFETMVAERLHRNEAVDRVLRSAELPAPRPPFPVSDLAWRALRTPAQRALWIGGIGLMPPVLRKRLGIRWTKRDERSFRALGAFSRPLTPVMPKHLRVTGPGQLRMRRRAIARGPLGEDKVAA